MLQGGFGDFLIDLAKTGKEDAEVRAVMVLSTQVLRQELSSSKNRKFKNLEILCFSSTSIWTSTNSFIHRTINSRYDTALENLQFQVFSQKSRMHDWKKSPSRSSTEIAWFSPSSYHRSLRLTSNNLTESSAGFLSSISWSNRDIRRDRGNFVKFLVASQVEFFFNHASWTFRKKLEIKGFRRPCHI